MIAIREIKILNKLHHENVIKLKEIVMSPVQEKDDQKRPCKLSILLRMHLNGERFNQELEQNNEEKRSIQAKHGTYFLVFKVSGW
ncbi:cyclin-dependent kinase C-2 [Trifolium repens]|nr:cyclin-dependent kinase C-2 [Trifolium repens]